MERRRRTQHADVSNVGRIKLEKSHVIFVDTVRTTHPFASTHVSVSTINNLG